MYLTVDLACQWTILAPACPSTEGHHPPRSVSSDHWNGPVDNARQSSKIISKAANGGICLAAN